MCGRRLSIQRDEGRYTYCCCLGQNNDPSGNFPERYVSADDLEAHVEDLYHRVELAASWVERLRGEMAAEIVERLRAGAASRSIPRRPSAST